MFIVTEYAALKIQTPHLSPNPNDITEISQYKCTL